VVSSSSAIENHVPRWRTATAASRGRDLLWLDAEEPVQDIVPVELATVGRSRDGDRPALGVRRGRADALREVVQDTLERARVDDDLGEIGPGAEQVGVGVVS
jgi:hypothetical protein